MAFRRTQMLPYLRMLLRERGQHLFYGVCFDGNLALTTAITAQCRWQTQCDHYSFFLTHDLFAKLLLTVRHCQNERDFPMIMNERNLPVRPTNCTRYRWKTTEFLLCRFKYTVRTECLQECSNTYWERYHYFTSEALPIASITASRTALTVFLTTAPACTSCCSSSSAC